MARTSPSRSPLSRSSATSGRARAGTTPAGSPKRKVSRARQPQPAGAAGWFPIALFGLFAVGCAANWGTWQRKRRSLSFQCSPDSPLYEPARRAAETWSAAIGRPVTVTPDGVYPIFVSEKPSCWDGVARSRGCSRLTSEPGDGYIAALSTADPVDYYGLMLHEMGHHLRGLLKPEHLEDPSTVMHAQRSVEEITPADVDFVCENFDCAIPSPARA